MDYLLQSAGALLLLSSTCLPAWDGPTSQVPRLTPSHLEERRSWRLPGEHEPVESVLLVWESSFHSTFADLLLAIGSEARTTLLVDPRWDPEGDRANIDGLVQLARELDIHLDLEVVEMETDSIWIRDFGPLLAKSGAHRQAVSFDYWGGGADDIVAPQLAIGYLEAEWKEFPWEIEGGNIVVDGAGLCVASTTVLDDNPTMERRELEMALATHLGCNKLIVVPPAPGEATGHVDMFMALTGPGEAIVGRFGPEVEPLKRRHLETVAAELEEHGLLVRRVPMPPQEDDLYRTFTNSLVVNGVVLIPYYQDASEGLEEAVAVFEQAYPGRRIVPVDATELIALNGSLHCAAITLAR